MQNQNSQKALDLESEIRKLSDRAAITDVVNRYGRGIHTNDSHLVASCFTDDAKLESHGQKMEGGQAIEKYYSEWASATAHGGAGLQMQRKVSTPYVTNVEITLDGDRAQVSSSGLAIHVGTRDDKGLVFVRAVFYRDEFVRTEQGWKIRNRFHGAHWVAEFPGQLISH